MGDENPGSTECSEAERRWAACSAPRSGGRRPANPPPLRHLRSKWRIDEVEVDCSAFEAGIGTAQQRRGKTLSEANQFPPPLSLPFAAGEVQRSAF